MNETRLTVLEALDDGPVTGPDLAGSLGISRAAVWKHVEALREAGFDIEGTGSGYVLASYDGYTAPTIEYGLAASFSIDYHDSLPSTNDRARELAADGAAEVAVVADAQTGGKGRLDREWNSPSGGIWTSVVTRPTIPPARAPLYTLVGAVATAETVREAGVDAEIKWPNDVIVAADADRGYRKLAGVLTEMEGETDRIAWLVCGIGVNANIDAAALPTGATSIRREAGDVDRRSFLQRLLERYDEYRRDLAETRDRWRELAATLDRRVQVTRPNGTIEGTAVDITDSGALVVDVDGERETVTAGDCEHLRPA